MKEKKKSRNQLRHKSFIKSVKAVLNARIEPHI